MNKFFTKNFQRSIERINEHVDKADIVPIYMKNLDKDNKKILEDYLKTLPPSRLSKILIME